MAVQHLVFRTTNTKTGKVLIGAHSCVGKQCPHWRKGKCQYIGAAGPLLSDIRKIGRKFFKFEPIKVFKTRYEMREYRKQLVKEEFTNRHDTYNLLPTKKITVRDERKDVDPGRALRYRKWCEEQAKIYYEPRYTLH